MLIEERVSPWHQEIKRSRDQEIEREIKREIETKRDQDQERSREIKRRREIHAKLKERYEERD